MSYFFRVHRNHYHRTSHGDLWASNKTNVFSTCVKVGCRIIPSYYIVHTALLISDNNVSNLEIRCRKNVQKNTVRSVMVDKRNAVVALARTVVYQNILCARRT